MSSTNDIPKPPEEFTKKFMGWRCVPDGPTHMMRCSTDDIPYTLALMFPPGEAHKGTPIVYCTKCQYAEEITTKQYFAELNGQYSQAFNGHR